MRDLTAKTNIMRITDAIGGGIVELHYRLPTTEERLEYQRACLVQDGDEVRFDPGQARVDFGLLVLTGIRDGDFAADGKPISSNPDSPDYREDWKILLRATASDLLGALGMAVFEGARLLGPKQEAEPPLLSSSGD